MLRATKIRLYPTPEQEQFLNAQFGSVRKVYNKALAIKNHQYKIKGDNVSPKKHLKALLPIAKKSRKYNWLKEYDSIALQQALINLDKAFQNFFQGRAKFPRFKSKHGKQSSYHCTSIKVAESSIKIPKLSVIKAKVHREINGKLKSITVSKTLTGKYYASLLVDDGVLEPKTAQDLKQSKILGIDLGITELFADSTGHEETNPRFLKRAERNLRHKQKALSRCKKGSVNRNKARLKYAKAHERLSNTRADFQHKVSRRLIDENQAIIIESLKSVNMMKNHKLAKAIGDIAWHSFVLKLEYKAKEQGKIIHKIDKWFPSSQLCSDCGFQHKPVKEKRLDKWQCPSCGSEHDRDINAAINIKNKGILDLKAVGHTVSAY